jgi:hypothetical protein
MTELDAALDIARRFGPIWLQTPQKTGYRGTNGSRDATRDESTIRRWCSAYPDAVFALMTGKISGIIGLDIDIKNGRNGLDSLELLGVSTHPTTPTAHTPSGGIHCLFRCPAYPIRSSQDRLGPGLEVKGESAWITVPPGPGRFWDPVLGPDTPLAPMPQWMAIEEPETVAVSTVPPRRPQQLSRYAESALDGAVKAIVTAPAGQQHDTLNREVYGIARLVAGGVLPAGLALEALTWGGRQLRSYDAHRPWRQQDVDRAVRDAFADGLARPRQPSARAS